MVNRGVGAIGTGSPCLILPDLSLPQIFSIPFGVFTFSAGRDAGWIMGRHASEKTRQERSDVSVKG